MRDTLHFPYYNSFAARFCVCFGGELNDAVPVVGRFLQLDWHSKFRLSCALLWHRITFKKSYWSYPHFVSGPSTRSTLRMVWFARSICRLGIRCHAKVAFEDVCRPFPMICLCISLSWFCLRHGNCFPCICINVCIFYVLTYFGVTPSFGLLSVWNCNIANMLCTCSWVRHVL